MNQVHTLIISYCKTPDVNKQFLVSIFKLVIQNLLLHITIGRSIL